MDEGTQAVVKESGNTREQLVQRLPGLVVLVDAAGSVISVTSGLRATPLALSKGSSLADAFDLSCAVRLNELIAAAADTSDDSDQYSAEVSVTNSDGSRDYYVASASRIDGDPSRDTASIVVLFCDISTERRLRQQLAQSQKMEALGQLAGGVAHDFNNLLAVLLSCLHFIRDGVAKNADVSDDLDEAVNAANRARTLTEQLLSFGRSQLLRPATLELGETLADLTAMLRRIMRENISLELHESESPAFVEVDRGHFEQVVMNLVINARDAILDAGSIQIRHQLVELEARRANGLGKLKPGPHHRLSITDNGGGMDDETCERMFEPFYTTKAAGRGTGLGLAVVYGMVTKNRGAIDVHSALGKGTRIDIYFPAAGAPEVAPSTDAMPAVLGHSCTVLLVEDDELLLRLSTRGLEHHGFQVIAARNGEEALRTVAGPPLEIDIVVSDVVMPLMGGIEFARALAETGLKIPVLLCSGYAEQSDEVIPSNVVGFMGKPYAPEELATRIRAVFAAAATTRR